MEKQNGAQKSLDYYIYDYLVSRNLHSSAEAFAKDANFQTKPDVLGDGILLEWWSDFWGAYYSRPGNPTSAATAANDCNRCSANSSCTRNDMHSRL